MNRSGGSNPQSHWITSLGARLHYVDWGNKGRPTVLMIHGSRDHCRSWDRVANSLKHQYHIVAMDLRGHGDSEHISGGTYGAEEFLFDIHGLVKHLGAPITVVAHSLGGAMALRYAGLYPDNVAKLVTLEAGQPYPSVYANYHSKTPVERMRQQIESLEHTVSRQAKRYHSIDAAVTRFLQENSHLGHDLAEHLARNALATNEDGTFSWKFDPRIYALRPEGIVSEDRFSFWTEIRCPVLMIFGSASKLPGLDHTGLADIIASAQILKMDGLGHWPQHEDPEKVIAAIRQFIVPTL